MPNTNAPSGFLHLRGTGAAPTYEQTQSLISPANTNPIFTGDPVVMAASSTGVGTGFITQYYGPVTLALATAVALNGVITLTFPNVVAGVPNVAGGWVPPIGSFIALSGVTSAAGTINGAFPVTSASIAGGTTTVTITVPGASGALAVGAAVAAVFVPVMGVFGGCKYLSVSQRKVTVNQYWPGFDASTVPGAGNVAAYLITDRLAQFNAQTANSVNPATAVGLAQVQQNIGVAYAAPNGNVANGLSTAYADQYTLTNPPANGAQLLPFRIVDVADYAPDGGNPFQSFPGNDYTQPYNHIVVAFNNAMPNQLYGV